MVNSNNIMDSVVIHFRMIFVNFGSPSMLFSLYLSHCSQLRIQIVEAEREKRSHSSQRAKKLQLEIAERSVYVMDCFLCIGRTAVSRANNSLKKSARIKNQTRKY